MVLTEAGLGQITAIDHVMDPMPGIVLTFVILTLGLYLTIVR